MNVFEEATVGLLVQVELSPNDCILSAAGGLLLEFVASNLGSLIVGIDRGERTTDPGVIVGSSSIDFN